MFLKQKYVAVLCFLFFVNSVRAQQRKIDSLKKIISVTKNDTVRVNAYLAWEEIAYYTDLELDFELCKKIESICTKKLQQKLNKTEKLFHQKKLSYALNSMGIVNFYHSNYPEALNYYFASLKIREAMHDIKGIASAYNNIGIVCNHQKNYDAAIKNYLASLKYELQLNNKQGIADIYLNLANVYWNQNKFAYARKTYDTALTMLKITGDLQGQASVYNGIGILFKEQNQYDSAMKYYAIGLKLREESKDERGIGMSYLNIGRIFMFKGQGSIAKQWLNKSLQIALNENNKEQLQKCYRSLADIDSILGDYKSAYKDFQLAVIYNDSLTNEENTKKSMQIQLQYEFEKIQSADSIKNLEKIKQEKIKYTEEIRQQKIYTYGGVFAFVLMLIVALISLRAYRQKQKINTLIAQQKQIVDQKQKEVMDSIHYAQRIQQSLMPSEKNIEKNLTRLKN